MKPDSLSFRRARPEDRAAVEDLCSRIWEGDDYIPTSFEAWVADDEGEFLLAFSGEEGGSARLEGLGKLSYVGPGEAWLEGLRKDPESRVKGLGKALCLRFLKRLAGEKGLRSVRFSTYFSNEASIALNSALGFRPVATASLLHASLKDLVMQPEGPEPVPLTDPAEVLGFVRASGWFGPFIHEAWKSRAWDEGDFVRRYVDTGACVGYRNGGRIAAACVRSVSREKGTGNFPFLDATEAGLGHRLATHCLASFAASGLGEAESTLPSTTLRALPILKKAGFSSWERLEDYLVFDLPLDKLHALFRPA
jgi:RimJ/RimL family protein N-acetyltransferase